MVKLFGVLMAVSIMLLLLACTPVAAPAPVAPQAASPLPAPVAPVISAEEAAWQKVVEAAKKEGKLTSYSNFLLGDVGIYVAKGFKDRTGLDLEVVSGTGPLSIERIKAERRAKVQVASVLEAGSTDVRVATGDGLLQPMGYLPSLADEAVFHKSPLVDQEWRYVAMELSLSTPIVNTNLVKPGEEPKYYKDLLEPKWKGRIALTDPALAPSPTRMYYYLKKYAGLDDSYFRALGKQVVFYPTNRYTAAAVAKGEMTIDFSQSALNMGVFAIEGAPVKAIDMEEGVYSIQATGVGLVKDAPHPNAARVYINWLLSQEGQTIFGKYRGTASFRKDVPNFEPPAIRVTPKKIIWATDKEDLEATEVYRSQVLKKLMTEK